MDCIDNSSALEIQTTGETFQLRSYGLFSPAAEAEVVLVPVCRRTQSLIDISNKASDGNLSIDDNTETQLVEKILSLFNDSNSEVRNLAAKTYVEQTMAK